MNKRNLFFIGLAVVIAVVVFGALLFANVGFLNFSGYFEKHDLYKDSIVLFFHDDCSYCTKVDAYIADNKVASKVVFVELNVENEYNRNELADKVQTCGLDINKIGVPFLWDGYSKKCVMGYIDIISFFRQKMVKAAK